MNPESDSIVELGTIDHPYKSIAYPFVEVLNYHAHTDRNLTIYLMENTRNELRIGTGHIVNISHVEINSYTLDSRDPEKATVVGMEEADIVANPTTSFSILKSYEHRFDEIITNNSDISDQDKLKISLEVYLILAYKSSISLHNLELISEYSFVTLDITFVYPVQLQHHKMTFKDLHMNISGGISRIYDPLNLHLENMYVDYYKTQAGFDMIMN